MKKYLILIIICIISGCTNGEAIQTPQPSIKIEHKYFEVGNIVENDYSLNFTINRVIPSQLASKEGFKWLILDIDFYNDSEYELDVPLCILSNGQTYFNGYSQAIIVPSDNKINSRILFEVPDNMKEFLFYTQESFEGNITNIDEYSRSIARIKL